MVPETGIEPVRPLSRQILSLLCLPISPLGRSKHFNLTLQALKKQKLLFF